MGSRMNVDYFMNEALLEAKKAFTSNEIPIGAVIVDNISNKIISRNYNQVNKSNSAVNHCEIDLIYRTCKLLKQKYLENMKNGYSGYTKLCIYPGYKFKVVDRLITNFHMPKSSLLMLVSAFIGFGNMKHIYKTAIDERYRFLSYGDVMLLNKNEI